MGGRIRSRARGSTSIAGPSSHSSPPLSPPLSPRTRPSRHRPSRRACASASRAPPSSRPAGSTAACASRPPRPGSRRRASRVRSWSTFGTPAGKTIRRPWPTAWGARCRAPSPRARRPRRFRAFRGTARRGPRGTPRYRRRLHRRRRRPSPCGHPRFASYSTPRTLSGMRVEPARVARAGRFACRPSRPPRGHPRVAPRRRRWRGRCPPTSGG